MEKNYYIFAVIAAALISILGSICANAGPAYSMAIGTNSVKVLPKANPQSAIAWATNTVYAQGIVVQNGSQFYMAAVGGTSATSGNGPSHLSGEAVDNTVTWRYVPKKPRTGFVISNDSGTNMYANVGAAAVVNAGIRLNQGGGSLDSSGWTEKEKQQAIYIISPATGMNLGVNDW